GLGWADPPRNPPAAPPPDPGPPPPKDNPAASSKSKVPAYVTLGIAGAGALVGTFFGIKALSAKSDFKDNPTTDAADDVERNALIADMAFGVAITLGVTGVVLLTSADSDEKAAKSRFVSGPRLRVAPVIGPTGGGAAAHLTF
ncbi:MAG TPA: PEGA domain-containing protein, partial [Polyangiaceae bacterium]|nr:PEGA domain-containing protein [Polyangiaceae bacterium]